MLNCLTYCVTMDDHVKIHQQAADSSSWGCHVHNVVAFVHHRPSSPLKEGRWDRISHSRIFIMICQCS